MVCHLVVDHPIQLSEAQGKEKGEYLQVMSGDMVSLNIVVVAKEFVFRDDRPPPKGKK